jgi:hypothetical protein
MGGYYKSQAVTRVGFPDKIYLPLVVGGFSP